MVFNSRIYHEELLKTMVLYQIISYYSKSFMFDNYEKNYDTLPMIIYMKSMEHK